MVRRILILSSILLLTLILPATVLAQQSYSFHVDKETVDVFWNSDGTQSIEYRFDFTNIGHPIDFVDVGMPNNNFDIGSARADVNGSQVNVSQSDYQGTGSGFAVVLGSQTIPAGASGTVHVVVAKVTHVLYPDSGDDKYASGDFTPTYFGSQYVIGNTAMTVTFHLPNGVKPNEPRWHQSPAGFPSQPTAGTDNNSRIIYSWQSPTANAYTQYTFGASFPASYVPAESIVRTSIFDLIIGALGALAAFVSGSLPCLCFAAIFAGVPILSIIQGQRRKLQYLPPRISIEGHGIKRGLTAVEAAILMEQPLDKVMTMILFGVIKKSAAKVTARDPLTLEITSPLPDGLNDYENDFLTAFKETTTAGRQKKLQDMSVRLVKLVSEKLRGFSRNETVDYYKSITEKAWQQVEAAGTPEVKSQKLEEGLEWTMLDKNYDDRTRRTFSGPMYVPMWWGNYNPTYHSSTLPTTANAFPASSSRTALPGADFAAQMVTGVQTFSTKVIGDLNSFTSKVTNVTNPPPPPSSSGSYRGGGSGGGCACACACAGCACACAGGGR